MKILKNELKTKLNIRTEKNFPIKGIEFIDITPILIQKESLNEIIDKFVEELKNKSIDYIVAPEARGFLIGGAIANKLNVGLIPVRKKGKLPPSSIESIFEYTKEYGKDNFELPKLVADTYSNKNFYIVDDIYATGNTINSICGEIIKLGGNVTGKGVIMNIVALNNDNDVFSLLDIQEEL